MKKYIYAVLLLCVFFMFLFFAFAKESDVKDVSVFRKNGTVNVISNPTLSSDLINSSVSFKNLDDSIIYDIKLNFDSDIYYIDSITDTNDSSNMKTSYTFDKNHLYMKVKYESPFQNKVEFNKIDVNVSLKVNVVENNPPTFQFNPFYILLIVLFYLIFLFLIISVFRKKYFIFMILFCLPFIVSANDNNVLSFQFDMNDYKILYDISFYKENDVSGDMHDLECVYDEFCLLPKNVFSKSSAIFRGWATENSEEVEFIDEDIIKNLATFGTVILYPVWDTTYIVIFDGNGSDEGTMDEITCVYGEDCPLLKNEFSKQDNHFLGWSTDSSGEVLYEDEDVLYNLTSHPNITLYAIWEENYSIDFEYTGSSQTYTAKKRGKYILEVWGAQGGYNKNVTGYDGPNGGYSIGTVTLKKNDLLYIYVGGAGVSVNTTSDVITAGGFNGGGSCKAANWGRATGGGGTDIRIDTDSLYARVIVAGGGGGNAGTVDGMLKSSIGGYGGGEVGGSGANYEGYAGEKKSGFGGEQNAGGTNESLSTDLYGTFGYGGNTKETESGGGGGWYGGSAGNSAGGGSGYVYTESTASNYPSGCLLNSSYYLVDAETIGGNNSFPSPSGGTETGHSGNGYARITYIGY